MEGAASKAMRFVFRSQQKAMTPMNEAMNQMLTM